MKKVNIPSYFIFLLMFSVIANIAIEGMYFIYSETSLIGMFRNLLGATTLISVLALWVLFFRQANLHLFLFVTVSVIIYAFLRQSFNDQLLLLPGLTTVNLVNGLGLAMLIMLSTGRAGHYIQINSHKVSNYLDVLGLICICLVVYQQQSLILSFAKPSGASIRYSQDVSAMFALFSLNAFFVSTVKRHRYKVLLGLLFAYFSLQGGGRGEFLAFLVLGSYMLFKNIKLTKSVLVSILGIIIILFILLPENIFYRLEFLFLNLGNNARVDIYSESIAVLFSSSKSLLGFGFDPLKNPEFPEYLYFYTVHNSVIDLYLTFGLLLASLLLILFFIGAHFFKGLATNNGFYPYSIAFLFLVSLKSGALSNGIILFTLTAMVTIGIQGAFRIFYDKKAIDPSSPRV